MFGFGKDDDTKFAEFQAKGHEALKRKDYQKARQNLEKAVDIGEQHLYKHNVMAELYDKLGMACHKLGDVDAAIPNLRQATNLYRKLGPTFKAMLAVALHDMGRAYRKRREYHDSAKCFYEEQEVWDSIPAREDLLPHIAACANSIGQIKAEADDFKAAKRMFEKALKLRRKCLPPNDPAIGETLAGLGNVFLAAKDTSAAKEYFSEALPIFKSALGPNHEWVRDIEDKLRKIG